jgi:chromosomal replication initiator protein
MSSTLSPSVRNQIIAEVLPPGISCAEVLSQTRNRRIARVRQAAMARLRAITDADGQPRYSFPAIGRAFDRDHTTVIHALRAVEKRGRA